MKAITIYSSAEILTVDDLQSAFENKCGVEIDGIIYLDQESIETIYDIYITSDSQVSPELDRIYDLIWILIAKKYNIE